MTATADITTHTTFAQAPRMVSAHRLIARASRRLIGASLILAGFLLWFAPGGSWDPDMGIMKLGLSVFVALAGLAVIAGQKAVAQVQVEIDTVRREIRLLQGKGRNTALLSRTPVSDLGQAEVDGPIVRLRDAGGNLLTEVAMHEPATRCGLMSLLRDEGKLQFPEKPAYPRFASVRKRAQNVEPCAVAHG